jgi:hypothetical protein
MNRKKNIVRPDNIVSLDYPVGELSREEVINRISQWCQERRIVKRDLDKFLGLDPILDGTYLRGTFKEALLKVVNKYFHKKDITLFHLANSTRRSAINLIINQLIALERRESEFGNSFSSSQHHINHLQDNLLDMSDFYEKTLSERSSDIKHELKKEDAVVYLPMKAFGSAKLIKATIGKTDLDPDADMPLFLVIPYKRLCACIKRLRDRYERLDKDERNIYLLLLTTEDNLIKSWLDQALTKHKGRADAA